MKKNHKTVDTSAIIEFLKKSKLKKADLSFALGMGPGFISNCINKNAAPEWTDLALIGLGKRQKKEEIHITMLIADRRQMDALSPLLVALGVRWRSEIVSR